MVKRNEVEELRKALYEAMDANRAKRKAEERFTLAAIIFTVVALVFVVVVILGGNLTTAL